MLKTNYAQVLYCTVSFMIMKRSPFVISDFIKLSRDRTYLNEWFKVFACGDLEIEGV